MLDRCCPTDRELNPMVVFLVAVKYPVALSKGAEINSAVLASIPSSLKTGFDLKGCTNDAALLCR